MKRSIRTTFVMGVSSGCVLAAILFGATDGAAAPKHAASTSSTTDLVSLPTPIGDVADAAAAQAIETTVAQYLELGQSVLIPDSNNSPTWPATSATYGRLSSDNTPASVNSSGMFSLSDAVRSSMVRGAESAAASVATTSMLADWDAWVPGAVASEGGSGFEVVGAGQYPTVVDIENETATTATVTTRVVAWQHQRYQSPDGSVVNNDITNGLVDTFSMVQGASGDWLVDAVTVQFIPGQGP